MTRFASSASLVESFQGKTLQLLQSHVATSTWLRGGIIRMKHVFQTVTKLTLLGALVALTPVFSQAQDSSEANSKVSEQMRAMGFRDSHELFSYFEIFDITVTENGKPFSPEELALTGIEISNAANSKPLDGSIVGAITNLAADIGDVKAWVTLGLKLWEVVKNNQPVMNVTTQTVSVLPESRPDWRAMESWKGPQAKSYTIAAKNLYGLTVISHTYTVAFHYGGSSAGRGQFLANATIIPTNVDVSWGFTLDSNVKVGEPLNTGSSTNPVPGIDLGLEWTMSSMLKKTKGTDQFYVRGDGSVSHVTLY